MPPHNKFKQLRTDQRVSTRALLYFLAVVLGVGSDLDWGLWLVGFLVHECLQHCDWWSRVIGFEHDGGARVVVKDAHWGPILLLPTTLLYNYAKIYEWNNFSTTKNAEHTKQEWHFKIFIMSMFYCRDLIHSKILFKTKTIQLNKELVATYNDLFVISTK